MTEREGSQYHWGADSSHDGEYRKGTSDNPRSGKTERGYIPIDEVADPDGVNPEAVLLAKEQPSEAPDVSVEKNERQRFHDTFSRAVDRLREYFSHHLVRESGTPDEREYNDEPVRGTQQSGGESKFEGLRRGAIQQTGNPYLFDDDSAADMRYGKKRAENSKREAGQAAIPYKKGNQGGKTYKHQRARKQWGKHKRKIDQNVLPGQEEEERPDKNIAV